MGDLGCREIRGLVVAVVDAPTGGSAKMFFPSLGFRVLREPADVPVGEVNNVLPLEILTLLTLFSRGHRLDGERAERQCRERRLLDGEYHLESSMSDWRRRRRREIEEEKKVKKERRQGPRSQK